MKNLYVIDWEGTRKGEDVKGISNIVAISWESAEKTVVKILAASKIEPKRYGCEEQRLVVIAD